MRRRILPSDRPFRELVGVPDQLLHLLDPPRATSSSASTTAFKSSVSSLAGIVAEGPVWPTAVPSTRNDHRHPQYSTKATPFGERRGWWSYWWGKWANFLALLPVAPIFHAVALRGKKLPYRRPDPDSNWRANGTGCSILVRQG